MEINNLYKKLFLLSDFNDEDNIEPFLETVEEIVSLKDPSCILEIVKYFDDDSDYGWVMQSMVHAIESFSDEVYIPNIMHSIPFMLKRSPEWLYSLTIRILNNPPSLVLFKQHIHLIPKESMLQLLDLVEQESEHHKDVCAELRQLLEKEKG